VDRTIDRTSAAEDPEGLLAIFQGQKTLPHDHCRLDAQPTFRTQSVISPRV
jgi:hypothetical protein